MVSTFLVLGAFELLFHAHGTEVSNVRQLASIRKTDIRVSRFVVVATVKIRVLRNHVAGDDFKTERLAAETRRACNHDATTHEIRVVNGPFHRLETTHGTADYAAKLIDAEALGEFTLGIHHVADGNHRESATVRLARAGVDASRACGAFTTT